MEDFMSDGTTPTSSLSKADLASIVAALRPMIKAEVQAVSPTPAPAAGENAYDIMQDEVLKGIDQAILDTIKNPSPPLLVKGARSTRLIDRDQERLNMLYGARTERVQYRTSQNVR